MSIKVDSFYEFMRKNDPNLYAKIKRDYSPLMYPSDNMGEVDNKVHIMPVNDPNKAPSTDWGTKILDIIKTVAPAYQQTELYKLQIKRAEQGLDPINPSAFAPTVNVGASPDIQRNVKYLTWGVLGLVGVAVLFFISNQKKTRK